MTTRSFLGRSFSVLVLTLALACGKSPDQAVMKYLDALKSQQAGVAYELMAKADRDLKTREAYIADQDAGELAPAFKALASKVSYTLKTVEVNQDKATVKVEAKRPDMKAAMATVMPEVMGLAFANMGKASMDKEAMQKLVAEKMVKAASNAGTVTEEEAYEAVKENGEWKVALHLADKERIDKLMAAAKKLEQEDRIVEAGDAAQKVLAIQPNHKEARAMAAELQPKIVTAKAAEAYFPMIKLGEPKYSKPAFFGKGSVRVSAKNTGDKVVKQVRVLYTLLDKDGNPVSEESGEYGFTKSGPLKPNFESEGFHAFENVPTSFSGKIAVKVVSLTLQ